MFRQVRSAPHQSSVAMSAEYILWGRFITDTLKFLRDNEQTKHHVLELNEYWETWIHVSR